MMLASLKLSLTVFCLVCTLFLYTHDRFSTSSTNHPVVPPAALEASILDSQSSTLRDASSSNNSSTCADGVPESANCAPNVLQEERPTILQATMMFGDKYLGLNERALQSHIDHAKRWGYGNHILRREIVGAGQWDKFIFSKILLVLELITGELKRPREERAQWVVWYDADTLILNPNIHWELFLPPDSFPDIHFMATKNVDGFNAGLFFFRVHEWSVDLLSDAYSLQRLRPEIDISGNIEQNALKYLFGQEANKKHVIYQPQLWYNGFKGAPRAETEINPGDMLVHFAGIHHDYEKKQEKELMSQWFSKVDQHPDEWQVPLERTKYPKEIEAFWSTYKEAKEMVDSVYGRLDTRSWPDQEVQRAIAELKWAIEELAYDAEHLEKCMDDMEHALTAAENLQVDAEASNDVEPQVAAESSNHVDPHAPGSQKEPTRSAAGGHRRFSSHQQQLRKGTYGKNKAPSNGLKLIKFE